jgi:Tfp pilus assembly protein PilX
MQSSRRRLSSEKGFALITAIMACVILFALAMLILNLSTGDLRVSARSVGDKKAMSTAEAGIHRLMQQMNQNFDPLNQGAFVATNIQVDPGNDPASVYTIRLPILPTPGPASFPLAGYANYVQQRYNFDVTGTNNAYNTRMEVGVAVGYIQPKSGSDYE